METASLIFECLQDLLLLIVTAIGCYRYIFQEQRDLLTQLLFWSSACGGIGIMIGWLT